MIDDGGDEIVNGAYYHWMRRDADNVRVHDRKVCVVGARLLGFRVTKEDEGDEVEWVPSALTCPDLEAVCLVCGERIR